MTFKLSTPLRNLLFCCLGVDFGNGGNGATLVSTSGHDEDVIYVILKWKFICAKRSSFFHFLHGWGFARNLRVCSHLCHKDR